jgi:hypothetical protein
MKLGYKATIRWLILNDDTYFLDDEYGTASVCASIVVDMFGVSTEKVVADMRKARAKEFGLKE